MARTAVKLAPAQIARAIALVAIVGPLVGFVLFSMGLMVGGVMAPQRAHKVIFASFVIIWLFVAVWSATRARRSTFWASASAASSVVAILLVTVVGIELVLPRNPEWWAILAAISLAVCAYLVFVTFFLWGAVIGRAK